MALKSRTSASRRFVWVAALAITLASIAGIRTLLAWCNDSHRVVELLNRLEAEVNYLSALEWESMARKVVSEDARDLQFSTQQEIAEVLGDLNRLIGSGATAELRDLYQRYVRSNEEQFRLIDLKRYVEAERIDQERIDPMYAALIGLMNFLRERYMQSGHQTMRFVDFGISAVLLLAAISVALLFSRFEQGQRLKQVLLAEQNALRQSEARFRSLVQNASEVMAVLNPLPPTVIFISDSVRRILGHGPDRLTGTDFGKLVHPDDTGKMQRFLANCAYSAALTHTVEVRLRRGDGQWTLVEMFGDNRLDDRAVGGIVINFRDVSETRQIEAALSHEGYEFDLADRKLH
jgi:PAS domain S-box-containing protein